MEAQKSVTLNVDCTVFTGTLDPTPVGGFFTWPTGAIVPIQTPVPEEDDDDDDDDEPAGVYIPCKAWFFFVS